MHIGEKVCEPGGIGDTIGLISKRNPSLTEILRDRKSTLEQQLKEVNEALEAMAANPEMEKIINLVTKVRY